MRSNRNSIEISSLEVTDHDLLSGTSILFGQIWPSVEKISIPRLFIRCRAPRKDLHLHVN
jgi:hypothetical protein